MAPSDRRAGDDLAGQWIVGIEKPGDVPGFVPSVKGYAPGMVEIERCWCDRWPRRCANRVTQEDMRCDLCRRGCCYLAAGDWSAHAEQVEWNFKVDIPAGWLPDS